MSIVVQDLYKYPEEFKEYHDLYDKLKLNKLIFGICKLANYNEGLGSPSTEDIPERTLILCKDLMIIMTKSTIPNMSYFNLNQKEINLKEFYHFQILLLLSYVNNLIQFTPEDYLWKKTDSMSKFLPANSTDNIDELEYKLYNLIIPEYNLTIESILANEKYNLHSDFLNFIYDIASEYDKDKIYNHLKQDFYFIIQNLAKKNSDNKLMLGHLSAYHKGSFLSNMIDIETAQPMDK